jgi:hypothetical protein
VRVVAIHVALGSRLPTRSVDRVAAEAGKGLVGDAVNIYAAEFAQ